MTEGICIYPPEKCNKITIIYYGFQRGQTQSYQAKTEIFNKNKNIKKFSCKTLDKSRRCRTRANGEKYVYQELYGLTRVAEHRQRVQARARNGRIAAIGGRADDYDDRAEVHTERSGGNQPRRQREFPNAND